MTVVHFVFSNRIVILGLTGVGMGMPQNWHRRQAMVLAGQLPESHADALLVLQAVHELVESFLCKNEGKEPVKMASNVLPFGAA